MNVDVRGNLPIAKPAKSRLRCGHGVAALFLTHCRSIRGNAIEIMNGRVASALSLAAALCACGTPVAPDTSTTVSGDQNRHLATLAGTWRGTGSNSFGFTQQWLVTFTRQQGRNVRVTGRMVASGPAVNIEEQGVMDGNTLKWSNTSGSCSAMLASEDTLDITCSNFFSSSTVTLTKPSSNTYARTGNLTPEASPETAKVDSSGNDEEIARLRRDIEVAKASEQMLMTLRKDPSQVRTQRLMLEAQLAALESGSGNGALESLTLGATSLATPRQQGRQAPAEPTSVATQRQAAPVLTPQAPTIQRNDGTDDPSGSSTSGLAGGVSPQQCPSVGESKASVIANVTCRCQRYYAGRGRVVISGNGASCVDKLNGLIFGCYAAKNGSPSGCTQR